MKSLISKRVVGVALVVSSRAVSLRAVSSCAVPSCAMPSWRQNRSSIVAHVVASAAVIGALVSVTQPLAAQFAQQGPKLVGSGLVGQSYQGYALALSTDGNTAIVGGGGDNGDLGAAWVFTRSNGVWTQQGDKLVGTGAVGSAQANPAQGDAVALSGDSNTAIVGGAGDNTGAGAVWVYTRSNGVWTQQGDKLVGTGAVGDGNGLGSMQGWSVALSSDGNTAIVGGPADNAYVGAAWVFTRSNGVWTQQGDKLIGTGSVAVAGWGISQGWSVALSGDGNTAIVGGPDDNGSAGAAWVFTRSDGLWTQQGDKLIGTGAVGSPQQGQSVTLSADGNTAIIGGPVDNSYAGAAWVFARSNGVWTQQGNKLVATGTAGGAGQGNSVAVSADGNTALLGGPYDTNGIVNFGAAWVFARSNGNWTQRGNKLVGIGAVADSAQGSLQGWSVALSGDGNTALVGGPYDNGQVGAAWVFIRTNAHDFNGDGKSDIAWRDTSGNVAIWEMNGTSVLNAATSFVANVPTNWSIAGTGDYDGDSASDILWYDTSGNVAIWEMNGTTILNPASSFVGNMPVGEWAIVGTGDFNGDGKSDILWRNTSGDVAIWEMSGTTILNQATSFVANVPGNWSVFGNGDYNGDGRSDILWRDTSGNVAIWEMNGIAVLNQATSFVANVPGNWTIVGTGDFNGDGYADILWRDTSGNLAIWEMNGTTILNQATSFVVNVPGTWSIAGSGDYNEAGKSDIVWRDTSGNVAIWEMNGTSILNASSSFVANVPGNWSIQDPEKN